MVAATTTCKVGADKISSWVPTLYSPGGQVVPLAANTQYRLDNIAAGPVKPTPQGLTFIFGSPSNTNPNATIGQWVCSGTPQPATMTIPTSCPVGATGVHIAIYPHHGCWDGVNLGPGLGRNTGPADAISHVRAGTTASCDAPKVRIPRPSFILRYPLAAVGGRLSSDSPGLLGGTTMHLDVAQVGGQDAAGRDFNTRVPAMCLNLIPDSEPFRVTCQENAAGELVRLSDKAIVVD